jgi:hypothetical protein
MGGLSDYLLQPNNVIDLTMDFMYLISFALKYFTLAIVSVQKDKIESESFWSQVESLNSTEVSSQIEVYSTFYWLNSGNFLLLCLISVWFLKRLNFYKTVIIGIFWIRSEYQKRCLRLPIFSVFVACVFCCQQVRF